MNTKERIIMLLKKYQPEPETPRFYTKQTDLDDYISEGLPEGLAI